VTVRDERRTAAAPCVHATSKPAGRVRILVLLFPVVLSMACSTLPTLDAQRQLVERGDLQIRRLTPRAFVETWGNPTYMHQEFTQFFVMNDGSLIPQSRLALGESPKGWETGLEAGDALYLAYADRGWYLVFYDERLVYREAMPASSIHVVGKRWKYEDQFKTRLEMTSPPLR
jgi:hypothetical protein